MNRIIMIVVFSLLLFTSCATIFQSLFSPNKCKKCEIIDSQTLVIIKTLEGCGGNNTFLERDAKVETFDLTQGSNLCNIRIKCSTWTNEKTE